MRAISFAKTEAQFLAGLKTVTRRSGWEKLKPGTVLRVVRKSMGLKRGEKQVTLGFIRVLDVRREPLAMLDRDEVAKEGFPDWSPAQFIKFYLDGADRPSLVTRIEFEKIEKPGGDA